MRWISYFILAYVMLGLQEGAARAMEWHNAGPNLVLLAVVFIALNAPRDVALLGCFMLGAMHDLISQSPLGLHALCYGLVAMLIVAVQQSVYREHPLTHFALTLFAGLITAVMIVLHGLVRPPAPDRSSPGQGLPPVHPAAGPLFITALYSAVLSPFVLGVLQRMKRTFQFQSTHRRVMAIRGR